jgi:CBS domain-containing protein
MPPSASSLRAAAAATRLSAFASAERTAAASARARACVNDPYTASVSQLLVGRAAAFASVKCSLPLLDAVAVMTRRNVGSLLVLDDRPTSAPPAGDARVSAPSRLRGIVTERDVLLSVPRVAAGAPPLSVGDVMSVDPRTIDAGATVGECMEIMVDGGFRHLPVVDRGELVGVLSIRDLVQKITADHSQHVEDLNRQLGRLANVLGDELGDGGSQEVQKPTSPIARWWH